MSVRDAPLQTLPTQPTPLVGRRDEVGAVCALLRRPTTRLVTLTGPGGTGKTRVALQVAAELLAEIEDGALVVELASILDPALVVPTIAQAIGVRDTGQRPLLEDLKEHLRERRLLLVLDNFEQVLEAAPVVAELLGACPGLKVLVTSRAVLRLRGEHEYPIPPLPLPEPGRPLGMHAVAAYPALDLFVQRAAEVRPDFQVNDEQAADIAEICRRLDGLPLAIELAAARVKLFSPRALLGRLERRLPLLTGGPRDLPARQRTLRDTIAWSYDLLTPEEQRAYRLLSAFVGGFDLGAEAWVIGVGEGGHVTSSPNTYHPSPETLDMVALLVDKNLLRQGEGPDGEPRFSMLETIREYGLEHLEASGEAGEIRKRHAAYFLDLAERAEPELWESDQVAWLDRLDADHDNLRAALTWALGDGDDPMTALRIATALAWFWVTRGHLGEIERLEAALEATQTLPADVAGIRMRATALCQLADAIRYRNDQVRPVTLSEESVALFRSIDDRAGLAVSLSQLAFTLRATGEYRRARAAAEEALAIAREVDDWRHLAWAQYVLASAIWFEHFFERARQVGYGGWKPTSDAGSPEARDGVLAICLLEESLAIYRQHGDWRHAAVLLAGGGGLAPWCLARGDVAGADVAASESLVLHQRVGAVREVAESLGSLATIASVQHDHRRAGRLHGACDARRGVTRTRPLPWVAGVVERTEAAIRARAAGMDFEAACEEGRGLTLEQAVAYALRQTDPFGDASALAGEAASPESDVQSSARREASALTPREREIAILVGRGYSNRRIAQELVIAEKTAEVHARNVREKLGLESRAQIAAWAAQHGLLDDDDARDQA